MTFIIKTLCNLNITTLFNNSSKVFPCQIRNYAARKGTREKARKKKVKKEEVKVGFIPHNQRELEKMLLSRPKKKFDDSWKQISTDNVYPIRYYQWRVYSFAEAVQCHRETHHPTMYNEPNAPLNVIVELNMQGEKKTRFVDNFTRVAAIPHAFEHGQERNLLVFSKDEQDLVKARDCGAALAGGVELVKGIQSGDISLQDFQYVVAHPNILPDLATLRGLMKRKFPTPKNGTLGPDVNAMVMKFLHGINYSAKRDEYEKDYGVIETSIGPLSMETKQLEENFAALIQDIHSVKPKREGTFITRCLLVSPPTSEKLKVDYTLYIENKTQLEEDDEDEVKASAAG